MTRMSHEIGRLCFAGDWACENDDIAALRLVALQLAACVPEPLHCELTELADICLSRPERAGAVWDRMKNRLYRETIA